MSRNVLHSLHIFQSGQGSWHLRQKIIIKLPESNILIIQTLITDESYESYESYQL